MVALLLHRCCAILSCHLVLTGAKLKNKQTPSVKKHDHSLEDEGNDERTSALPVHVFYFSTE